MVTIDVGLHLRKLSQN